MKIFALNLFLLLTFLVSPLLANPRNPNPETPDQVWQNDQDLLDFINTDPHEGMILASATIRDFQFTSADGTTVNAETGTFTTAVIVSSIISTSNDQIDFVIDGAAISPTLSINLAGHIFPPSGDVQTDGGFGDSIGFFLDDVDNSTTNITLAQNYNGIMQAIVYNDVNTTVRQEVVFIAGSGTNLSFFSLGTSNNGSPATITITNPSGRIIRIVFGPDADLAGGRIKFLRFTGG